MKTIAALILGIAIAAGFSVLTVDAIDPCLPTPTPTVTPAPTPTPTTTPTPSSSVSPTPVPGIYHIYPGQKIADKVKLLKAGETLVIHEGTYNEYLVITNLKGTSDKPITIKGEGVAVVKGSGDNGRLWQVTNSSYVVITGLRFTNSDKLIYALNIQNFTFKNNEFDHSFGEALRIKYFSSNNIIKGNNFHDCGVGSFVLTDGSKNGECVYIGTAPEQLGDNPTRARDESNNNIVRNNKFNTQGNECVDIKEAATGNIVEYNSCTGQKDIESGGFDSRGSGNTFRYNEVFGNQGAGIRVGGDKSTDGLNNNIYGNNIHDNKGYALKVRRWPQGKICGNTHANNKAFTDESRLKDIACL